MTNEIRDSFLEAMGQSVMEMETLNKRYRSQGELLEMQVVAIEKRTELEVSSAGDPLKQADLRRLQIEEELKQAGAHAVLSSTADLTRFLDKNNVIE